MLRFLDHTHTHTHTALPCTSDQPVAQAATYTTQQTQETNIHALSRICTHDSSNKAATDLHLRLCGHMDQSSLIFLEIRITAGEGEICTKEPVKQILITNLNMKKLCATMVPTNMSGNPLDFS
jgi:hypothetical protein